MSNSIDQREIDEATSKDEARDDKNDNKGSVTDVPTDNSDDLKKEHDDSVDGNVNDAQSTFAFIKNHGRHIQLSVVAAGLLLGFVLCFIEIGGDRRINQTIAIALWMATLWLTEIVPLVVTAFLPIFLFPLFGIVASGDVEAEYANDTIFLFISGFLMALTLERWNIHKRVSLKILTWCGVRPQLLLLGVMGSTFILSMFLSNTATALMMVPNALSICNSLEESMSQRESKKFGTAVMLGIAYAANVGGISTLIGTPPNLVFQRQLKVLFPDAPQMTFAEWIGFGLPVAIFFFLIIWAYLCVLYLRGLDTNVDASLFPQTYKDLGPWTYEQITVSLLFVLEGFLWLFRSDLDFNAFTIKGWTNIFPEPLFIEDSTVGMAVAVALFVLPGRTANLGEPTGENEEGPGGFGHFNTTLLNWPTANRMPYDIVFLFGGGFALATGFVDSGLSSFLGERLANLDALALPAIVFIIVTLIIWLTELTSNTATANIMIPIAASIAVAIETNPYTIMIPVTIACSCAFFLPVATPPNMVVFASGRIPLREMNKAGFVLNIIGSVIVLGAAFSIVPAVLGVAAESFPSWATTLEGGRDQAQ